MGGISSYVHSDGDHMTAMAISLSTSVILDAKNTATHDVAIARRRVGFALTVLGHLADFAGSYVVGKLNLRLETDLMCIKGIVGALPGLDPSRVIDENNGIVSGLDDLQKSVQKLQGVALEGAADVKLRATHKKLRECAGVCTALFEEVGELRRLIVNHDERATLSDDVRRLMADLKRTDDVPHGRYAALAAVLEQMPQRQADDKRGDPAL